MKTREFDTIDKSQSNGINRVDGKTVCLCWFEESNTFGERVRKLVTLDKQEIKGLKGATRFGLKSGILTLNTRTKSIFWEVL
jgi:hypothetical protein